jgi:GGDEF domain-containing protein
MNVDRWGMFDAAPQQIRRVALQSVKPLLRPYLRDEDIMARFDQTIFAFLLPDMAGEAAKTAIEKMQMTIASIPLDPDHGNSKLMLHGSAGIVTYPSADLDEGAGPDDLLDRAAHALKYAENTTYGKVHLGSEHGMLPEPAGTSRLARPAVNGKPRQDDPLSESSSVRRMSLVRRRR